MDMKFNLENETKEMEEKHIIAEFSKKKRTQYLITGVAIVIIIFLAVSRANAAVTSSVYGWILVGIAVAAFAVTLFTWRCPACNKYLGRRYGIKECRHCGVKLQK